MGNCFACARPPTVTTRRLCKRRPWQLEEPITRADLNRLREEFWAHPRRQDPRTRPEIWFAIRAVCLILLSATEPEPAGAQAILDYAGIRRRDAHLEICYDDTNVEYYVPPYLHSEPTNLIEN